MFTGIIEGLGTVAAARPSGAGKRLTLTADFDLEGTKLGDSIAVSGACLTVVALGTRRFEVDVAPETLHMTTLGGAAPGERVNLERALRLSDRLDGHLVSGHVDGQGRLLKKERAGNAILVTVGVPKELTHYMVTKGSVAVDGISLTINAVEAESFVVSIIPHTAHLTTIGFKAVGATVNVETDLIGKYIERFVGAARRREGGEKNESRSISRKFLEESGFI